MPFLTTALLHGESGSYPTLTLKAHAGRVFLIYLGEAMQELAHQQPEQQEIQLANMATQSLLRWFHLIESSPKRFVSPEQAHEISRAGYSFLRITGSLARLAIHRQIFRWKLLPKHHAPRLFNQNFGVVYIYIYTHTCCARKCYVIRAFNFNGLRLWHI